MLCQKHEVKFRMFDGCKDFKTVMSMKKVIHLRQALKTFPRLIDRAFLANGLEQGLGDSNTRPARFVCAFGTHLDN